MHRLQRMRQLRPTSLSNRSLRKMNKAKSELEQAKKNVTVADDACSKAQTEYDALVQAWKKKQAAVAALNEKLQAVQSCDWENGYEFDAALEQSDERFSNLNKLVRAYIKAKEGKDCGSAGSAGS